MHSRLRSPCVPVIHDSCSPLTIIQRERQVHIANLNHEIRDLENERAAHSTTRTGYEEKIAKMELSTKVRLCVLFERFPLMCRQMGCKAAEERFASSAKSNKGILEALNHHIADLEHQAARRELEIPLLRRLVVDRDVEVAELRSVEAERAVEGDELKGQLADKVEVRDA
jgi:hypothetical protein